MSKRTGRRVASAAAPRSRDTILEEITALGLPLPGSLVERTTRCGNPRCRCHGDPPQLHGPYLTWTRKVDNKTITRTLTREQADRIRPLLNNGRRLRELVAELETIGLDHVERAELQRPT